MDGQGGNVDALVTVHLLELNVTMSMGVSAAANRQSDEVWLGSSRSTSLMAKLPCGQVHKTIALDNLLTSHALLAAN